MRKYLIDLREAKHETQQDVAIHIGISRQYYSMIENGIRQRRMDTTLITLLSNHFGISPVQLLDLEQQWLDSEKEET